MGYQVKTHVQIGDLVQIMAGAHKKKIGKILFLDKKKSLAILDCLVSFERTKQQKATKERPATVIRLPKAIAISNLMLWDEGAKCATRSVKWGAVKSEKCRMFPKTNSLVNFEKQLARHAAKRQRRAMHTPFPEKNESATNE